MTSAAKKTYVTTEPLDSETNEPPKDILLNPDIRASHIAIVLVIALLLAFGIILLVWSIWRCGGLAAVRAQGQLSNLSTIPESTSGFRKLAFQLVDTGNFEEPDGYRWCGNNESIISPDGKFEFGLTKDGNGELYQWPEGKLLYQTNTKNSQTPGSSLLMGVDGYVYIRRNDGSRVKITGTERFYQSPNQLKPYSSQGNQTIYIDRPFYLGFYEYGLVLYSTYSGNTRYTKTSNTRIDLWWISSNGIPPPNVLPNLPDLESARMIPQTKSIFN